ncbi:alpha/beta-hydrolase [Thozetella sp. PMI_491]|nr:alpha/beta-hydrolase [Thozetella sp. PMI_491]
MMVDTEPQNVILPIPGHGSLRGLRCGTSVHKFLGVPYALPPVGGRRWQKPTPLPADFVYGVDGAPLDCTKYGPICPQPAYVMRGMNLSAVEGSVSSEDCLLLNIWLPAAAPPQGKKWPVYVWLHGGWLQMGNPCHTPRTDPWELVDEAGANLGAIVIAVGYRLNIFGFLAGEGLNGNFGLWDQRCALEWVQRHISSFGGDPNQVTLGGLSAGAFSTHSQLQYELLHAAGSPPLFHNIFMCSNAISVQPKSIQETESQLQEVLDFLGIDPSLSRQQRLSHLRKVSSKELIAALSSLRLNSFRAVTDQDFIHGDMIERFRDGTVAKRFRDRGIRVVIGETESEQHMYSLINPPSSMDTMQTALENYYPAEICDKLISTYDRREQDVGKFYGMITSDIQVRAPIRAFCKSLVDAGVPLSNILRYRSGFRARCIDSIYSPDLGVTHSVDMCVWWYLIRFGYKPEETTATKDWLGRSLIPLIRGKPLESGCTKIDQYLKFMPDATIAVVDDLYWNDMIALSELCIAPSSRLDS